jgi:tRNA-splicing endonuclease subunit Sen2
MPSINLGARIKWKRGKHRQAREARNPESIISELANCVFRGAFHRESVWISCPRRVASLFDQLNIGRRVRECVARDVPFVHRDVVALRLSPEDAFYLHAVVGCLVVYAYEESVVANNNDNTNDNNTNRGGRHVELSRDQFWTLLRETAGPAFGLKCVATCHFRLQGWLPRSGLQYGADLVLYRRHPSLVHSDCCALILPENDGARNSFDVFTNDEASSSTLHEKNRGELTKSFPKWYELQSLSRLCVQVNKKLILCSISVPEECDWRDSGIIAEATVKETEISRFNQLRIKNLA